MASADWIEWTGGECPVPGDTLVLIDVRDEPFITHFAAEAENNQYRACDVDWTHEGTGEDILAYRVVTPA